MEITTLGIDLAKSVFQLHGVNKKGAKVFGKKLSREKLIEFVAQLSKCTIAMEACGGSHYWGRKFRDMGHEVKLLSPQFVKPFVKSNKNDANDAEAIVEASLRPSMRFVALKTVEQQNALCLHRVRERLVCSRTALINEIRGLLGEFGISIPQGAEKFRQQLPEILEDANNELSAQTRALFVGLREELKALDVKIAAMDKDIENLAESQETSKNLMTIPGVGPVTASAIVASVGDASIFKNGREMSGWLGIVPRQNSSGGKTKLGGISKRGDKYLRKLVIHGARSVLMHIDSRDDQQARWLKQLVERRGFNRACVALANKNVRTMWALMTTGESFRKERKIA